MEYLDDKQVCSLLGILTDRIEELQRQVNALKALWTEERNKAEERKKENETL